LFTSGVLDVFMEINLEFELIISVSAGAMNAANFIAGHVGRSARINIIHSNDTNFFGLRKLLFTGNAFNFDYLFHDPINTLYPYNEYALMNSRQRLLIAATDLETGKAVYFEENEYNEMIEVLRASSSMPLWCRPVNIDGRYYLDGAVGDAIGVHKAISEGFDKIVVVVTRDSSFIRPSTSKFIQFVNNLLYKKRYPEFTRVLNRWADDYNILTNEIKEMEKDGRVFVIRPSRIFNIKNLERDARKLVDIYFLGRDDGHDALTGMLEYLNKE
jgi:predicted patatin/cPLA2 family phospholipase